MCNDVPILRNGVHSPYDILKIHISCRYFLGECLSIPSFSLVPVVKKCNPKEILTAYLRVWYSLFTGEDKGKEKHFTDKDICKPFLLGICISDLFVNTVRPHDSPCMYMYMYVYLWVGVPVVEYIVQTSCTCWWCVIHCTYSARLPFCSLQQWKVNDIELP